MNENNPHLTIIDDLNENLDHYQAILSEDYRMNTFVDPINALNWFDENETDLFLVDIHMPKMNGFDFYKRLREKNSRTPVIFLTGDASEETTIEGLKLGAEDFIVKPVSIAILKARIKNKILLNKKHADIIKIKDFVLYCDLQQAKLRDEMIALTPIEFKLIQILVQNPNKIFSRKEISDRLWPNTQIQNQNLDTHLSNLRKKLKPFSQYIKTIKSRGYLLRI